MRRLLVLLRRSFVTGLVLVLPLAVTCWILITGFKLLVGLTSPAVTAGFEHFGLEAPPGFTQAVSLLATVLVLMLLGLAGRSYLGRQFGAAVESLLLRVPLAKVIYGSTKQLLESFQRQKGFQRVVLVEFPRPGCWTVGFLTSRSRGFSGGPPDEAHVNVFVPTTPNPTSGYLIIVPERDVKLLDMNVEEGITFVMSGGVASPELRLKPPEAS